MCGGNESIVKSGFSLGAASARDRIGRGTDNQGNVRRDLLRNVPGLLRRSL
jgi:hypothetical protein